MNIGEKGHHWDIRRNNGTVWISLKF